MCKSFIFNTIFITFVFITLNFHELSATTKKDLLKQTKLPLCRACKTYITSFKQGMVKTATGKFEGGDAAWEEEKLRSYSKSEVRLVEIQEHVCSDVEEGQDQCYSLNEQHDALIEDWWFNHQEDEPDLFNYFCIDKAKCCCPDNHYGPTCVPCQGYPDNICSNNGKCKGAGTRKGNGQCACDKSYGGAACEKCADKYFEAYKDEKKLLCSECHIACEDKCTKAGPKGCIKCANGWITDEEKGCLDLNECAAPKSPCTPLQFCVNTEGSFKCLECDRSCAGCSGDGPDMCNNCASGYILKDNMCVDAEQENRQSYIHFTRYCTYLGLCVATCIIFQRNFAIAAVIGLAVAVYISLSEYILNTPPTPNTTDIAEKLAKVANQLN